MFKFDANIAAGKLENAQFSHGTKNVNYNKDFVSCYDIEGFDEQEIDIDAIEDDYSDNEEAIQKDNVRTQQYLENIPKSKSKIINTNFDELGYFHVQYENDTQEVYTKSLDDNSKPILTQKTSKIPDGTKTEYYNEETGNIEGENFVDEKNNTSKYISYAPDSTATYVYNDKEGTVDSLQSITIKGDEYETVYEAERNSNSDVSSFTKTEKKSDGTIMSIYRYNGERAKDAIQSNYDGKGYMGFANEEIHFNISGEIQSRTVREISPTGALESISQFDSNGSLVITQNDFKMDDKVGTAYQRYTGDCYLLASINSIAKSEIGQKILKDNLTVSQDEKGQNIYNVKFPGAKIAMDDLKTRFDNVHIKGEYTVTQEEIDSANIDTEAFSDGDQNVLVYELAYNKYRKDVAQTIADNKITASTYNISGLESGDNPENPIDGGFGSEAKFILTGKRAEYYYNPKNLENRVGILLDQNTHTFSINSKVKLDGEMSSSEDKNDETQSNNNVLLSSCMTTADIMYKKKDLESLLDKIIEDSADGNIDNYAVTAGINVSYDGDSYGGHEISVKNVTKDFVTIVDSNDYTLGDEREYTIPMKDFKKCLLSFDVTKLE